VGELRAEMIKLLIGQTPPKIKNNSYIWWPYFQGEHKFPSFISLINTANVVRIMTLSSLDKIVLGQLMALM
jgi:hypothetical protein